MFRFIKYTTSAVLTVFIGGFLLFGSDLTSMLKTSAHSIRKSARESVPVEFELDRAKDQINDILPDLQSQVRMIAEEEVAISRLEKEVNQDQQRLGNRRLRRCERKFVSIRCLGELVRPIWIAPKLPSISSRDSII